MNITLSSSLKKGSRVRKVLYGAGVQSEEHGIVLEINARGVWLDNGVGNDPSGPFDRTTGWYLGPTLGGFSERLVEVTDPSFRDTDGYIHMEGRS